VGKSSRPGQFSLSHKVKRLRTKRFTGVFILFGGTWHKSPFSFSSEELLQICNKNFKPALLHGK